MIVGLARGQRSIFGDEPKGSVCWGCLARVGGRKHSLRER